jgi:hypothetical protein
MTAAELCFIAATVVFVLEALPGFKTQFSLLAAGLALVAFGLALNAGFADNIDLEGEVIAIGRLIGT